jgi:hypothetical protein
MSTTKTEKQKQQERKDARVAKALRDNLRRRKQAVKKAKLPK